MLIVLFREDILIDEDVEKMDRAALISEVYCAGLALFAGRLFGGFMITKRVVGSARAVEVDATGQLSESDEVLAPLAVGYLFPRIILPINWRNWDATTLKMVIAHEASHVRRRDGLIRLLAAINQCLFWFHPLAWWIGDRLAILAEYAADDAVLGIGGESNADSGACEYSFRSDVNMDSDAM